MIFPTLKNKKSARINLNESAKKWLAKQGNRFSGPCANPFNDPVICTEMVEDLHKELGVDFSYGGYMEDRSFVWRGSYLEEPSTFIHLGVDLNAPRGTSIAIDFDAEAILVDDDYPEIGGWGTRVVVKHKMKDVYLIYAHLDRKIAVKTGDSLSKSQVFAAIGHTPYNGNWFPHVHVQILTKTAYDKAMEDDFLELDGYGSSKDMDLLKKEFPDPMGFIEVE
jgi:murein DD-endopeptidase MepM/ murein hydrolase activator NlpD